MYKSGASTRGKDFLQVAKHSGSYSARLNFYDQPPLFDVTLEEFEEGALNRLRILSEIESSAARNRTWEEVKPHINKLCEKYLPLHRSTDVSKDVGKERKNDHLSHFVLRLAFCRSEDLRRRFIKAESTLFKIRYDGDGIMDREAFLESRQFGWIDVIPSEKAAYSKELLASYQGPKHGHLRQVAFESEKYCKVKWTRVPDLVEKRKVFLKDGWAYVPEKDRTSIIFEEFEVQLARGLEMTARSLPRLDEDSRLIPILDNLSQGFLAGVSSDWSAPTDARGNEIKAESVDELARQHFPLCMRMLHENLRKDHHLKHFGRLQYGLFLKVLGLSIEEAIAFWRKSFDRVTDDRFNKDYKYNIRHSYGLEGKRANYPAKSCQQILTSEPSEYGCPYRRYSPENLQTALLASFSSRGLTSAHLPEIMGLVKQEYFHVACTRVFEITHKVKKGDGAGGESITHPNQYAVKSMELAQSPIEIVTDDMAA